MILAGIDEAGYGPLLGPLVVGCAAFALSGENPAAEELPCLWKRLKRVCAKHRDKTGRKLHINDSKLVYSPSTGLKELERSVLTLAAAMDGATENLPEFLNRVAPQLVAELVEYAWYAPPSDERFPIEQDAAAIRVMANCLKGQMEQCGTKLVHLAAQVLPERRLNRLFDQTRNKSSVLFSTAAIHLDHLLRTFGRQNLTIFCDRQGGRERYGQLLRLMFEDWALEVVREEEAHSEYRLLKDGHAVRLIFREKAETQCMSVAVASMLCKYIREALMRRFNAYWRTLVPGLQPTAGYYTDGMRFLKDIATKRAELKIADSELVRAR